MDPRLRELTPKARSDQDAGSRNLGPIVLRNSVVEFERDLRMLHWQNPEAPTKRKGDNDLNLQTTQKINAGTKNAVRGN